MLSQCISFSYLYFDDESLPHFVHFSTIFFMIQSYSIETMGNCTGTNSKSKPIKSLQKQNLEDQQNRPPVGVHNDPKAKITLQEAIRKRDVLKKSLMEGTLDPPVFFVHKIEPLTKRYNK